MPKKPAPFVVKSRVSHPTFGLGTIKEVNERYTTIVFDENGTKKFMTSMVELESSTIPAPTKTPRKKKASASK